MKGVVAQHLYIIQSEEGCFKIGRSNDPHLRLNQLQTGNAYKLQLLLILEGKGYMESVLHEQLKRYRKKGEWFNLDGLCELPNWIYEQIELDKVQNWLK